MPSPSISHRPSLGNPPRKRRRILKIRSDPYDQKILLFIVRKL